MKISLPILFSLSLFLSISVSAQPEPLTEGVASWQDVQGLTIDAPIDVTQSLDDEYPSLAIDSEGVLWAVWSRREESEDQIYLSSFKNDQWTPEVRISDTGCSYKPEILCDENDRLHIFWSTKLDRFWQVAGTTFKGGLQGEVRLLTDANSSARNPAFILDSGGAVRMAWESDIDGTRSIYLATIEDQVLKDTRKVSEGDYDDSAPSIAAGSDGSVWVAWHRCLGGGNTDIYLRKFNKSKSGREIAITNSPAGDFRPSIDVDRSGRVWLAWHTNQDDPLCIINWVEVRCWNGEKLLQPESPMPGKDLTKVKMDQGFEFPTLHVDRDDRVWVFGRPSHNFCVQYYQGKTWSSLIRLPEEGWGGRGQYVKVVEGSDGGLWTIRRDLQKNKIQKISPNSDRKKLKTMPASSTSEPISYKETAKSDYSIEDYKLYFGDIHSHTWLSDGMSSIDEYWIRMRDAMGWDFAALTDHDFFVGNKISHCEWEELKYLADAYNEPGKFAAIQAYEWTTARPPVGFGHKNVYFSGDDPPLFNRADASSRTAKGLYALLKPYKALVFPHHIAWTGADWENYVPEIETCFEIVSNHGVFEYMGNEPIHHRGGRKGEFIQDGLGQGYRFGIVGGSDSHGLRWHHSAGYKENPWEAGLTALYATDLSRKGVIEALRSKRCYATTGVRIEMDVQADGHLMGESYVTETPPNLKVRIQGTAPVHYAIVVRNNEEIFFDGGNTDAVKFQYTDSEISPGVNYYYVRYIQRDGNMAWSSPIWVDYRP